MTDDTRRPDDWTGEDWAGDTGERRTDADTEATAATSDRWNKSEYVGDRGEGAPAPVDPDTMPEGENKLDGGRHAPGESHWAGSAQEPVTGDRPLEQG
ncbi:MAG TPA: hypothetical protein VKB30_09025 [Candidatus Limnocylindrales bacterium]|nr:hypothetical protein [Candidatus Limnocylindrales bacterium]